MKDNKIIKDKPKTLGPTYDKVVNLSILEKETPLIMEESDRNYIVVEEFSGIGETSKQKVVKEQTSFEDEYDENGNLIYYAEEVFDEDDDIYSESFNDRAVVKEAHRTFAAIGETIDKALSGQKIKTKIGYDLLCAMKFSRLLYFRRANNLTLFAERLFAALGNHKFIMTGKTNTTIADEQCLYDAIVFAKTYPNQPTFVYINNVKAADFYKFIRPVYPYIDNPNGDFFVSTKGRSILIPRNIYFVYTLAENEDLCKVSRRALRFTSILEPKFEILQDSEYVQPVDLSIGELDASFKEATDSYSLKESSWKKIDSLVNLIHSANNYVMHNKIVSRLECYAVSRLANGIEEEVVLDELLANNFIVEAIITENPLCYTNDVDLINLIDSSFGMERMMTTKKLINDYIELYSKGGKYGPVK